MDAGAIAAITGGAVILLVLVWTLAVALLGAIAPRSSLLRLLERPFAKPTETRFVSPRVMTLAALVLFGTIVAAVAAALMSR